MRKTAGTPGAKNLRSSELLDDLWAVSHTLLMLSGETEDLGFVHVKTILIIIIITIIIIIAIIIIVTINAQQLWRNLGGFHLCELVQEKLLGGFFPRPGGQYLYNPQSTSLF